MVSMFLLQEIENLDKAYLEQKGELAALQERLDDLARERWIDLFFIIHKNQCC